MRKRIIALICVLSICFSYFPLVVNADLKAQDQTDEDVKKVYDSTKTDTNKNALSDDNASKLGAVYAALKTLGLSDVAAAAIVGNAAGESGGRPDAVQVGGAGIGIFQWSNDSNREALEEYCSTSSHSSHEKVNLNGYMVCNRVDCQCAFLIKNMGRLNKTKWSKNYNTQVNSLSKLKAAANAKKIPQSIDVTNSLEGFKNQTKLEDATIQFYLDYETAGATKCFWVGNSSYSDSSDVQAKFIKGYSTRYSKAKAAYDKFSGGDYEGVDSETAEGLANQLVENGVWDDGDLINYAKLVELDIQEQYLDNAKRENLTSDELYNLDGWLTNLEQDHKYSGIIKFVRMIVVMAGILMIIWGTLLYLAFWFDRVNSLFDIDCVYILTLGKMRTSDTDESCTFTPTSCTESGKRTVNHRAVILISLTAIVFGIILMTGKIYVLLSKLFRILFNFFS